MTTTPARVTATPTALEFISALKTKYGPLLFFQSGGCCDGSSPLCYARNEYGIGDADVYLGDLDGTPFYMGSDQFEYWRHTQLIIDVVAGMGGMFSLDNGTGKRFLTRSRLFTDEENDLLGTTVLHGPQV
ncbi:DUF779 domain-containing protein [Undibacterium sp. CY18W]|uniref:DUF779 domain-containing protein n=1 Tax=Undibacterium hunanense TaxID=2762292 RepID=A0ABR6ZRZ5_9BURK|nr:DUF779 domain-containing protein [Undibacterium hunanense]MBC3918389.1 DUF779 domain-containing protein [Undibacterium hunanense]